MKSVENCLIRFLFSLLLLMLSTTESLSQNIAFNHLTPDEGLSQISVNSLYADRDGNIWIATRVGLNCYDGNKLRIYANKRGNKNSLFCNNVKQVTGDGNRFLYLLCAEGIAQLDLTTLSFKTLLIDNNVGALCYHKQLFFSDRHKIMVYQPHSRRNKLYLTLPTKSHVTSINIDSRGRMWIGTRGNGVYCLASGKLSHPIQVGNITQIYEDHTQTQWIGSWNNGLWTINRQGKCTNITKGKLLNSNFVRAFCEDNSGMMWIGTYLGLTRYNPRTDQASTFIADNRENSLTNSSIWSIIKDKQGTLWLGTYFGGINYFNPEYEIYTQYRLHDKGSQGLSSQIVGRMTEDDKGNLWICTEGGGLNIYHPQTKAFSRYPLPGVELTQNNLKAIFFDKSRRTMWVGAHLGGLDRISLAGKTSRTYRHNPANPKSLPSDIVRDIKPYGRHLIVATQEGVAMMDPETDTFTPLLASEKLRNVQGLCIDKRGRLWVATESRGVYCYHFATKRFRHFQQTQAKGSLSCNNINHIMTDRQGRIWLSTANDGIDLYDEQHNQFINYGHQEGLIGNCVYATAPSSLSDNELLLITNQGFSVFNLRHKSFRNYNKDNGFPLATINENALYVTPSGTVYLGGVRGMVSFKERDLHKKTKPFALRFTRLYINGQEVLPQDATHILDKTLNNTKEIELDYDHSVISIEYASSNHIQANTQPLEYRLTGTSNHWFPIGRRQRTIDFFNLPSGRYTLELRPIGTTIPSARLQIRILPPWYRSFWAIIGYILLTGLIIIWLVRGYRKRIKLSESLKYEQQHAKDIEERNQSKLRFFTNVSHEIRTPLTVIMGLSEALLHSQRFAADIHNKLQGIYRNSQQLRDLISELLDFKKQEHTQGKLCVEKTQWSAFVKTICNLFKEYANAKDISLTMNATTDTMVWIDQKQMKKVVNNLIANALKYTPQGGTIVVTTQTTATEALLQVADSGKGIAPADLEHVFDCFYQVKEFESLTEIGTGIGLNLTQTIVQQHHGTIHVTSEINKGTTFTVAIPLGKDHFNESEVNATPQEKAISCANNMRQITAQSASNHEVIPMTSPDEMRQTANATILIVEDNDDIRQLLVTVLSPYFHTITAVDGREGLEVTRDVMPDIIISDVLMPHLSGLELCKMIKEDLSICHIPVILLTAQTALNQELEGLKIGADDYITKPFNNEVLVSRCNNLINSRRLLQHKFGEHPHTEANMLASNPLDKAMLDKAIDIIDKHYMSSDFSVEVFAREMGLSRTSLFTKWKTLTGQTPNEFIMQMRLRKAAKMLRENPQLSIAEISYKNGFSSPRYFCKCFKDRYQQQPSAYRNTSE